MNVTSQLKILMRAFWQKHRTKNKHVKILLLTYIFLYSVVAVMDLLVAKTIIVRNNANLSMGERFPEILILGFG